MPDRFNMSDVMISYSRRDTSFVQTLERGIARTGRETWVDWDDIPPTVDWWSEIQAGIEAAHTFIFVISPHSVRSDICRQEIDHASLHNKRIIPVLYQEITDEADKALMHPVLSSHNWIMFRKEDNHKVAFRTLITALETDMGHVRQHTRLLVLANEWIDNDRRNSLLLRGDDLQKAESWLQAGYTKQPTPTKLHVTFINDSRKLATKIRRRNTAIASGVFVALLVLTLFAMNTANQLTNANGNLQEQKAVLIQIGTDVANANQAADSAEALRVIALETQQAAETLGANANKDASTANAAQQTAQSILRTANANLTQAVYAQDTLQAEQSTAAAGLLTSEAGGATAAAAQLTSEAQEALALEAADLASTQQANAENLRLTAIAAEANAVSEANAAQADANSAQQAADAALAEAASAQQVADAAQADAASAQQVADAAQADAEAAQAEAEAAQADTDAAIAAQAEAEAAQADAEAAQADAEAAQAEAEIAQAEAEAAQADAEAAQAEAEIAQAVAANEAQSFALINSAISALTSGDRPLAMQLALLAVDRPNAPEEVNLTVLEGLRRVASSTGLRQLFTASSDSGRSAAFFPSSTTKIVYSSGNELSIWDYNSGSDVGTSYQATTYNDTDTAKFNSLAVSPDGNYIAAARVISYNMTEFYLFDDNLTLLSRDLVGTGTSAGQRQILFHPNYPTMPYLFGRSNTQVFLYKVNLQNPLLIEPASSEPVPGGIAYSSSDMDISADGSRIAFAIVFPDKVTAITINYDDTNNPFSNARTTVSTGINDCSGDISNVEAVTFINNSNDQLVAGGQNCSFLNLINLNTASISRRWRSENGGVSDLIWACQETETSSCDNETLYVGLSNTRTNTLQVWDYSGESADFYYASEYLVPFSSNMEAAGVNEMTLRDDSKMLITWAESYNLWDLINDYNWEIEPLQTIINEMCSRFYIRPLSEAEQLVYGSDGEPIANHSCTNQ